ncbi:MAG: TonB-dependent receptor [Steroidobacteraceae bacterium]|nr:TonB-dependent receptor [Steroidobacteraceae bacterium]
MSPTLRHAIAGLLLVATAVAQPAETELETLVVTGTRLFDAPHRLPYALTSIGQAAIEVRNPASLPDLLGEQPGLHVSQPGGGGGVPSLFIRGGEPNFTAVLVDGVKVNDPNNTRGGSFDASTLDVGDVERIEIVRGPQSAIYGSDSLSGVVNVITRAGAPAWGVAVNGEVGSDDYHSAGVTLAGPVLQAGGFTLRAATRDEGDSVAGSTFENRSVNAKLLLDRGRGWDVTLHGRYVDSDGTAFPEDSGGPELAVIRDTDVKAATDTSFGASGRLGLGESWSLRGVAYRYDHDEDFTSPGIAPGVREGVPPRGSQSELVRTYAAANAVWVASTAARVTIGVDYQRDDGESEGYVELFPGFQLPNSFELDRDTVGVFAELQAEPLAGLTLLGSVRHDDADGADAETTSRLGAIYAMGEGATELRANWGQGFKLPSFFSLGSPLVGNPDLRPETSESFDLGVSRAIADGRARFGLTYFDNDFEDLIDFDPELFLQVNRKDVQTSGIELEGSFEPGAALGLRAHVTYVDYDIPAGADPLRQRPEWRGGLELSWRPRAAFSLVVAWLYVGETYDTSVPTGGLDLGAYHRVDANLRWSATPRLTVALAVDNLFDAEYEDAIGFPAPGFRPRLGVSYRFE